MVSNFQKKKKRNFAIHPWMHLVGILVLIVLLVLVVANIKLYQKKQEFLAQAANFKSQIKNLQDSNHSLQNSISQAGSDQYIEKVAREQLDLQKPGETAVSFVMPQNQSPKATDVNQSWLGWISAGWQWIKNNF